MARTSDTDALVATIMAKALKDTIHRLEAVLETHIETSSELSPVGESDPTDDDDPLRRLKAWFIANLACPYPSLSQRQRFASDLGVPVRNINGQFTNWRRRTGWSRIKKEWAGNTHEGMSTLLSRYTAGTESRPDVRAAIRRMTQYLEDDTAGQWINTVSSTCLALLTRLRSFRGTLSTPPLPPADPPVCHWLRISSISSRPLLQRLALLHLNLPAPELRALAREWAQGTDPSIQPFPCSRPVLPTHWVL
jgi:hypothetical protein